VRLLDEADVAERAMVTTVDRALLETQRAFDRVAPTYDRANRANPLLSAMRETALATLLRYAPRGARILDLGCGPGTDAPALAAAGYEVTAIDWSPAMVEQASARAAAAAGRVTVWQLGIHELDRLQPLVFDAVWSNFGPLNCIPDLGRAACLIADRVASGGFVVASVIGRICPWELALYAARLDWSRLRVRFARGPVAVPLEGGTVWTQYYTPAAFARAFHEAGFQDVELRGLAVFMPPPYLEAFAIRHPTLISRLQRIDSVVGAWPGVRSLGDHFLIVLRKR
jgi:SAM-dependent methyltransferase